MVLYVVLKGIAEGSLSIEDPGSLVWIFVKKAIGGPIIGMIFGYTSLWWITHVFNDPMVEISLSITTAYLAYYVSEFGPLESSGVLTVVCVGLCFSKQGRTSISPEVFHFLHEFWETLGYMANTIIFLITGIAIVTFFMPSGLGCVMVGIGVSLTVLLDGAFRSLFAPLRMPIGTLPFCFAGLVVRLSDSKIPGFESVPLADVSTPEDHLYAARVGQVATARAAK